MKLGQHRSVIREIFEYGNQRRREIGTENVLDFSLGNPSVPTPEVVSEALKELIETVPAAELHAYTSAAGDLDVRNAVAEHICDRFGVPALGKHIYMTAGAAASLAISLKALVEPGDEGQRHELQVRRSTPVTQVKEMIKMKTAIPPKKQIVNCNGKKLEDGKIMGDYGIQKGHSLFMTYPCIGG